MISFRYTKFDNTVMPARLIADPAHHKAAAR